MTRHALRYARYILALATVMATTAALNFTAIKVQYLPQGG